METAISRWSFENWRGRTREFRPGGTCRDGGNLPQILLVYQTWPRSIEIEDSVSMSNVCSMAIWDVQFSNEGYKIEKEIIEF